MQYDDNDINSSSVGEGFPAFIDYVRRVLSHDLFDASDYLRAIFVMPWRLGERKKVTIL